MAGSGFSRMYRFGYHSSGTRHGIRGLLNYGLSCCVNALLQSFSATWELIDLLDKWNPIHIEQKNSNVPLQLSKVLKDMQSNQYQPPASHQDFLHCLDRNNIRLYVQHDADEVFLSILNSIQKQMEDEALSQAIHSLYKVSLEMLLECRSCGFIQSDTNILLSLPLHIDEDSNSLEGCIRSFFEPEMLRDSERWHCEKCESMTPVTQSFKVILLPAVLCLHLKRFRSCDGDTQKLRSQVTFPETFDFLDNLKEETLSQNYVQNGSKYSLFAVIVHIGNATIGHYTAYVRHKVYQNWYYADDSSVRQATWRDVQNTYGSRDGSAYLLLYRKDTLDLDQDCAGIETVGT